MFIPADYSNNGYTLHMSHYTNMTVADLWTHKVEWFLRAITDGDMINRYIQNRVELEIEKTNALPLLQGRNPSDMARGCECSEAIMFSHIATLNSQEQSISSEEFYHKTVPLCTLSLLLW